MGRSEVEVGFMELGALSFELDRPTLGDLMKSVKELGFTVIQLHFYQYCNGRGSIPSEKIPDNMTREIAEETRREAQKNDITVAAAGAYYNMVSRDINVRIRGLYSLEKLASYCGIFDCNLIALCTGSRSVDPENMWEIHPDNNTVQAWHDICEAMEQALAIAEHYGVYLGLEVEASNIINTPEKARALMDTMRSPYLKVILDGANLFPPGTAYPAVARDTLAHAFDLLGEDIISVHGKDIKAGPRLDFTYAGNGIVDFDFMLDSLKKLGYKGNMVLHGNHTDKEMSLSLDFMKGKLRAHGM